MHLCTKKYLFCFEDNLMQLKFSCNYTYLLKNIQQKLAAAVQIHDVIDKNEHFHLQSTPYANVWTGAKGLNRITLKR